MHCDLGLRVALDNCPTRVNPHNSKIAKIQERKEPVKKANKKFHNYSIYTLADELHCDRATIRKVSIQLFDKSITNFLTNDEMLKVIDYIKHEWKGRGKYRKCKGLKKLISQAQLEA